MRKFINENSSAIVKFILTHIVMSVLGLMLGLAILSGENETACISPIALTFQGGFDLYNNGFAAGFVAAILAVVCESIYGKERRVVHAKK